VRSSTQPACPACSGSSAARRTTSGLEERGKSRQSAPFLRISQQAALNHYSCPENEWIWPQGAARLHGGGERCAAGLIPLQSSWRPRKDPVEAPFRYGIAPTSTLRLSPAAGPQTQRGTQSKEGLRGPRVSLCPPGQGSKTPLVTLTRSSADPHVGVRAGGQLQPCTPRSSRTPAASPALSVPQAGPGCSEHSWHGHGSAQGPGTAVLVWPRGETPRAWYPHCCVVQVFFSLRGVNHNPQLFFTLLPDAFEVGN